MVRRVLAIVVLLAIAALLLVPAGAMAADGVRATLDGRPISLEKAGQLSCHDFDFPMLTCYRTSDELLEAIDQRAHPVEGATSALAVTSGYVVVFQHGAYAGAAQSISQNYSSSATSAGTTRSARSSRTVPPASSTSTPRVVA